MTVSDQIASAIDSMISLAYSLGMVGMFAALVVTCGESFDRIRRNPSGYLMGPVYVAALVSVLYGLVVVLWPAVLAYFTYEDDR